MAADIRFLTVTWSNDKDRFSMLRKSILKSSLSSIQHDVVVQSEDFNQFQEYAGTKVGLLSSKDILPEGVDDLRLAARAKQLKYGRRATRLSSSLARYTRIFDWSRYLGWQAQQLSKLAYAASSDCDSIVILDSDVIVTRHADLSLFQNQNKPFCFERFVEREDMSGKTKKWVETAESVFGLPSNDTKRVGSYFDTPFIMIPEYVRSMINDIETRYNKPWWQALIGLPPRRWSEFALYKNFLRNSQNANPINWAPADNVGFIFDLSSKESVLEAIDRLQKDKCHYITLHSQASGKHDWSVLSYADQILEHV